MKTLMICTGNICRSPMAQGLWQDLLEKNGIYDWLTDSAALYAYHTGEAPDKRAIKTMANHGIDISHQQARPLCEHDFSDFDLILVATDEHLKETKKRAPKKIHAQIEKLLASHPNLPNHDLRDPYYGNHDDFEITYNELLVALTARINIR